MEPKRSFEEECFAEFRSILRFSDPCRIFKRPLQHDNFYQFSIFTSRFIPERELAENLQWCLPYGGRHHSPPKFRLAPKKQDKTQLCKLTAEICDTWFLLKVGIRKEGRKEGRKEEFPGQLWEKVFTQTGNTGENCLPVSPNSPVSAKVSLLRKIQEMKYMKFIF